MGCWQSRRVEREEPVIRTKARRRYMKQVVSSRQSFSFYHSLYLHSLRSTGAALLQFADVDDDHNHRLPPVTASPPRPPPPPLSSSSSSWAPPSAPSPPPPPSWDFWDPFAPPSSIGADEESSEGATNVSESPRPPPPPPPPPSSKESTTSELAMVVVPRVRKDFSEIVRELDEYFLKAALAGNRLSAILQVPNSHFDCHQQGMGKFGRYGRNLSPLGGGSSGRSWAPNLRSNRGLTRFGRFKEESGALMGHTSTVEKLYAWEKKLYLEVKTFELFREEHEKRARQQRKYEVKGVDYVKIEQNKRKIERLESKMTVASQAIESTSSEIIRLRESELFPQLLELVNGLMCMWSSMYECHQVQTHIVQQLEYLTPASSSSNPTSDIHRQASHQLELEVDRWYSSFCHLIKSQRDYIHSLTGWLRLSLFQSYHLLEAQKPSSSNIYSLCEEWQLALDRVPDKVASEGIKSFATVVHAVILQQGEEQKQKKRSESAFKELEKRVKELRSLESKYGPYSSAEGLPIMEKKKKVDALRAKVEEEKGKYEKSSEVTRAMTINNLQTVFPNVFQAMTGFSSVCMQAFEAVYNHQRGSRRDDLKQLQN